MWPTSAETPSRDQYLRTQGSPALGMAVQFCDDDWPNIYLVFESFSLCYRNPNSVLHSSADQQYTCSNQYMWIWQREENACIT